MRDHRRTYNLRAVGLGTLDLVLAVVIVPVTAVRRAQGLVCAHCALSSTSTPSAAAEVLPPSVGSVISESTSKGVSWGPCSVVNLELRSQMLLEMKHNLLGLENKTKKIGSFNKQILSLRLVWKTINPKSRLTSLACRGLAASLHVRVGAVSLSLPPRWRRGCRPWPRCR